MTKPREMRQPVTLLIPNYQGYQLLQKNLDSVLAILQKADELLIIDDASPDQAQTLAYLQKRFKLTETSSSRGQKVFTGQPNDLQINLVLNQKNLRFARSVNLGFCLAKNKLVFLLNNDVLPKAKVLDQLIPYFDKIDTFAVTCQEINGPKSEDRSGKNKLWFERGLFMHAKADDLKSGETAWASGGSSLIDRDKFLSLGGFDRRYQPAYWEDIDLSFQARKQGWKIYFEEEAMVEHRHETTNSDVFGQQKIRQMSWRNGQKFTRKNANFRQLLAYLIWRPYWLIKSMKFLYDRQSLKNALCLALILLLAILLRFYQLGSVPHGMALDEAAIGYNGFAIWQTRRDEWLNFMPISFRSFGDYKAPLAIYISSISTAIFGLNLWAVRLPFALAGVLAVLGLYLLAKELFARDKNHTALWLALLLAISPWHLHYSRLAFESGLALALTIWAVFYFYRYLNQFKLRQLLASVLLASSSLYAYHSSKITTPVLFLGLIIFYWPILKKHFKHLLLVGALGLLSLAPLLYDAFFGAGLTRAGSSLIFSDLTWPAKLSQLLSNFISYFDPRFLIGGEQSGELRHGDGRFGVLAYPTFIVIIYYFLSLIKKKNNRTEKKICRLALFWLLAGLLPAIIGDGVYHSNRALLALPAYLLLTVLGLERLALKLHWPKKQFCQLILLAYALFLFIYQKNYYQHYARISANAFNDGYLETLEYIKALDKSAIDKILFTNDYGLSYIYVLFSYRVNPFAYHGGILVKYEFADKIDYGDLNRPRTIVVASQSDEMMHYQPDKIVYGSDGQIRFKIYLPKP